MFAQPEPEPDDSSPHTARATGSRGLCTLGGRRWGRGATGPAEGPALRGAGTEGSRHWGERGSQGWGAQAEQTRPGM